VKRAVGILGRVVLGLVAVAFLTVVGIQYGKIVMKNIALRDELDATQRHVVAMQRRIVDQQRDIARLSDPQGAVPEIHARLHLVSPHESIVILKAAPSPP